MRVVVEIVGGARAGQAVTFDDPETVRIGRHPDCDVAFDAEVDRDASARHAELRRERGGYVLYDLDSQNGTRARGARLRRLPLTDGDEVEFGAGGPRCRFRFERSASDPAPAPAPAPAAPTVRARGLVGRTSEFLRSFRTMKLLSLALVGALVATAAALVAVLLRGGRSEAAIRRELLQALDDQRRANSSALQQKIDELNRELMRARAGKGGREIAASARDGVYLLAARSGLTEEGFCTAFAVGPRALATNAHCVALAESLRKQGAELTAVKNGDGRARFAVTALARSAEYVPGGTRITPDVGLVTVDADLPSRARLADRAALATLAPGDVIYTYGFPGRLADTASPEATFVEGVIGRLTRLDGEAGAPEERVLIQHSAFTAGGTSGSPIFDEAGRVIGVNAGGYVEDAALAVRDPRSGKPQALLVTQPLHGYNFGMRIDLVEGLLAAPPGRGP